MELKNLEGRSKTFAFGKVTRLTRVQPLTTGGTRFAAVVVGRLPAIVRPVGRAVRHVARLPPRASTRVSGEGPLPPVSRLCRAA